MGLTKGYKLKEVTRNKALNIRLTEEEYEKLERIADEHYLTKTEIVVYGIGLAEKELKKKKAK